MSLDEAVLEQSDPGQIPSPLPPEPRSRLSSRSLFFSGSQPEEEPESLLEAPSQSLPGDGSVSDDESLSDLDESLSETSSQASSGDAGGPLKPLGKAALRATTRKGVLIATSMAHRVAARTELEKAAGLYIADEQDQELIADPIANILHRRGGVATKLSPDANDALAGLMGFANYFAKQVALIGEIRAAEAPAATDPQQVA
jgi:hypothetical protein